VFVHSALGLGSAAVNEISSIFSMSGCDKLRGLGCLLLAAVATGGLPGRPTPARAILGSGVLSGRAFAVSRRALLANGAAAALLLPTMAPAATTAEGVQVFEIASAALDRRAYRGLILPNGMRILLASDPAAGKAAAAMNVQVRRAAAPHHLARAVPSMLRHACCSAPCRSAR